MKGAGPAHPRHELIRLVEGCFKIQRLYGTLEWLFCFFLSLPAFQDRIKDHMFAQTFVVMIATQALAAIDFLRDHANLIYAGEATLL